MGSISKEMINGGLPVLVSDDSSPGTALVTATVTSGQRDELYLYVNNTDSSVVDIKLVYDNTVDSPVQEVISIPAKAKYLVIPGLPFNTMEISAYVMTGDEDKLVATGFINRITP